MLFRKIIAVFSENRTKPTNTLRGQNAELLMLKEVVHIVTTGLNVHLLHVHLVSQSKSHTFTTLQSKKLFFLGWFFCLFKGAYSSMIICAGIHFKFQTVNCA
jgi:hypothetical protein